MRTFFQGSAYLFVAAVFLFLSSCKKDEAEVIAGFSYKADANNFLLIQFTNASQNFKTLEWDFGDGQKSSEENPSHTYAAAGSYTVKLTATSDGGDTDVSTQTIEVADTDAELTKIAGTSSKTWKLLRVTTNGRYPMQVGPFDRSSIWWAMGRDNDEIAIRTCSMNDEFTFKRNGDYVFDDKGDFWVEGNWYAKPDNICAPATAANMKDPNGADMSAFGSGTHKFTITPTKLTLTGLGAWIGLFKLGTDVENKLPKPSTTYNVIKLHDGPVDTLILENNYKFNAADPNFGGYWRLVLVHYDNPAEEPGIPDPQPAPDFSFEINDKTVTFTNKSKYATSYAWDFGDGSTSTAESPVHTYSSGGVYTVKLTASNSQGSKVKSADVSIAGGAVTKDDIVGAAWKVRVEANSIFVGPGLGDPSWWQVPLNFLNGGGTGGDDWSCITNDEFIFSADGKYEYKTNGDARNDGYFGSPNGCWTDAQVAGSGNGSAFGSNVHSFAVVPPSGSNTRSKLVVTNGTKGAAFVGFYKGYYGGENSDSSKAPNGGSATNTYEIMNYFKSGNTETLILSVDISADKNGSAAWTVVLTR
jgi:PKD repeat protein